MRARPLVPGCRLFDSISLPRLVPSWAEGEMFRRISLVAVLLLGFPIPSVQAQTAAKAPTQRNSEPERTSIASIVASTKNAVVLVVMSDALG